MSLQRIPRYQHYAIACLAVGETLVWAGTYYIFPALMIRWESDLGWSRTEVTLALMLATIASAIASPVSGRLIDYGRAPALMAGSTVVAGLCVAALSQTNSLQSFYILWIIIGFCLSGCLYEPCFALITRALMANAKRSITAVTLVAGFASTLAFPAAHALSEHFGWRSTALVFSAVVILVAAPLLWTGAKALESQHALNKSGDSSSPTSAPGNYKFLSKPVFWLLATGFSLTGIVHGTTLYHLLPLLTERGLALPLAVTIVSFIGPMQVAGRVALASLGDRLSNHKTVLFVFFSMAASILCLIAANWHLYFLWLFVPLFGTGYGMLSIIRPVIAQELLGSSDFGSKSGVLALVYLLGAGSAPWLGSLFWRIGGYALALPLLVLFMLVALMFYLQAIKFAD